MHDTQYLLFESGHLGSRFRRPPSTAEIASTAPLILLDRKIRQKCLSLWCAHVTRMAKLVKTYECAYPVDIGILSTYAVVQPSNLVAQLIQQFGRRGNWGCLHF